MGEASIVLLNKLTILTIVVLHVRTYVLIGFDIILSSGILIFAVGLYLVDVNRLEVFSKDL